VHTQKPMELLRFTFGVVFGFKFEFGEVVVVAGANRLCRND